VLGDMLELGPQGPALHAGLAEAALATGADEIYLVGPGMQALADVLGERVTRHAANTADIAESVLNRLAYGDAIMIKGSNGMKLGALVRLIADRFA
jgi:UDP-N-acetylmuramoyl-tripeptide--D-alanyl-D-alanine ligase